MTTARWTATAALSCVLLAACGTGSLADAGKDFDACVEKAGLSLAEADDWSPARERRFLSRPEALACVVREVPAADRADLLSRAFPGDEGSDEASDRARVAKTDALVKYAEAHVRDHDRVLTDLAALMDAFGWDDVGTWSGPRRQVALALLRARGEADAFDTWLSSTGRSDDYQGRIDFIQEQETKGTVLADQIRQLSADLVKAQVDA